MRRMVRAETETPRTEPSRAVATEVISAVVRASARN